MTILQAKYKKKISEIRNLVKSICVNQRNTTTNNKLREAIKSGSTEIDIPYIARGREYTNHYNLPKIISALSSDMYCDAALFLDDRSEETYNLLLNAYFKKVLSDIFAARYKEKKCGYLFDTDICLNILFAMMYCSETIIEYLLLKLKFFYDSQVEDDNNWRPPVYFSGRTLLPMVYYFYIRKYPDKPFPVSFEKATDSSKKSIPLNGHDIYSNISPIYKSMIDSLYNEDSEVFKTHLLDFCLYHLDNSKDNFLLEFNNVEWQYFPVEILFLLKERVNLGYSIDDIKHPLIDDFLPYFLNDFTISEENQYYLNLLD